MRVAVDQACTDWGKPTLVRSHPHTQGVVGGRYGCKPLAEEAARSAQPESGAAEAIQRREAHAGHNQNQQMAVLGNAVEGRDGVAIEEKRRRQRQRTRAIYP